MTWTKGVLQKGSEIDNPYRIINFKPNYPEESISNEFDHAKMLEKVKKIFSTSKRIRNFLHFVGEM